MLDDKPLRHAPPLPRTYDYHALALGHMIEEASQRIILNPRALNADDLELADRAWMSDMALYRQALRYAKQKKQSGA